MKNSVKKISDYPGFIELCEDMLLSKFDIEKLKNVINLQKLNAKVENNNLTYIESIDLLNKYTIPKEAVVLIPEGYCLDTQFSAVYVNDPSFVYWSLFEFVERSRTSYVQSQISNSCIIGANANISNVGVIIEDNVFISENAIIRPGVIIKRGSRIGPGSVIGSNGLEVKDTNFGKIVISHVGGVIIGENVEIGALCSINQGLGEVPTQIGTDTKIDSSVHIAHSCSIGNRNIISANVTFGGSVKTGTDIFFGLNSTIKNRVEIADGSFIGASAFVVNSYSSPVKLIPNSAKPLPIT